MLKGIAQGKNNQEIADWLGIGIKTVKSHVSNIFVKLDVLDRTQAAIYAIRHHLDDDTHFPREEKGHEKGS